MKNIPRIDTIMTRKIVSLPPDMPVLEAMKVLSRHHLSGAPVVNSDSLLCGMLSEKDCLKIVSSKAWDGFPMGTVEKYMCKKVITCNPNDDVFSVADIFFHHTFRRLPVMEEGALVGIVCRSDILKALVTFVEDRPWTDADYLTEDLKIAIQEKTVDKKDVRVDAIG